MGNKDLEDSGSYTGSVTCHGTFKRRLTQKNIKSDFSAPLQIKVVALIFLTLPVSRRKGQSDSTWESLYHTAFYKCSHTGAWCKFRAGSAAAKRIASTFARQVSDGVSSAPNFSSQGCKSAVLRSVHAAAASPLKLFTLNALLAPVGVPPTRCLCPCSHKEMISGAIDSPYHTIRMCKQMSH